MRRGQKASIRLVGTVEGEGRSAHVLTSDMPPGMEAAMLSAWPAARVFGEGAERLNPFAGVPSADVARVVASLAFSKGESDSLSRRAGRGLAESAVVAARAVFGPGAGPSDVRGILRAPLEAIRAIREGGTGCSPCLGSSRVLAAADDLSGLLDCDATGRAAEPVLRVLALAAEDGDRGDDGLPIPEGESAFVLRLSRSDPGGRADALSSLLLLRVAASMEAPPKKPCWLSPGAAS